MSPSRSIGLLRAINVGGHNVKMEYLRVLFSELGLMNIETFIASGNVLFDTPEHAPATLERMIEQHLQQALGYAVTTFIRTPSELVAAVEHQPFVVPEGSVLQIGFLCVSPTPDAQQRLLALQTPVDLFHLHGRELYWLRHGRVSESTITGGKLEKALGLAITLRNLTTVRKLGAKG